MFHFNNNGFWFVAVLFAFVQGDSVTNSWNNFMFRGVGVFGVPRVALPDSSKTYTILF